MVVGNDKAAVQTLDLGLAASASGACAPIPELLLNIATALQRQVPINRPSNQPSINVPASALQYKYNLYRRPST